VLRNPISEEIVVCLSPQVNLSDLVPVCVDGVYYFIFCSRLWKTPVRLIDRKSVNYNFEAEWATGHCDVAVIKQDYGINLSLVSLGAHLVVDVALLSNFQSVQVEWILLVNWAEEFSNHHLRLEDLLGIGLSDIRLGNFLHLSDQLYEALPQELSLGKLCVGWHQVF